MAAGRYATYWHRSTGGPIKDKVTFMASPTAAACPQQQKQKAVTLSAVLGKLSLLLTTTELFFIDLQVGG